MSDPDQQNQPARNNILLDRLLPAERENILSDPFSADALYTLSAYSPALTRSLSTHLDLARWLFLDKSFQEQAPLNDLLTQLKEKTGPAVKLEEVQQALRWFRLKETARLAVRDLTGRADLVEVTTTLSALADACLAESLAAAERLVAERHGIEPEELGLKPIVLGMGKLGAGELNYSSDVDLIYLYQADGGHSPRLQVETLADSIFTTLTRLMSELTGDGIVFRVDLDLRPGGKDGDLAQSFEKALRHYLILGRPWERLAMLKARPVAGDLALGNAFLTELNPFIFRRHLDYTTLEELKALKERFTRERRVKMRRGRARSQVGPPLNVKLSPGGIREIEFFAQALVLTFGGRLPYLREITTLGALEALAEEKIISPSDAEDLSLAYIFLRNVEHRLQLREMTQTQTLPRDPEDLKILGRSMGFIREPEAGLKSRLKNHMDQVERRFKHLLEEPGEKAREQAEKIPAWVQRFWDGMDDEEISRNVLSAAGFKRPQAVLAACRNIRGARYLPDALARYQQHLERLLPTFLLGAADSPDPDQAVLHLERFLIAIGPKAGFLVLLEENPKLIRLISLLLGSSNYLADILIKHPAVLDSLIDRRSAASLKTWADMIRELDTLIPDMNDTETALAVIRRFKNDETLRIGLYDLLGKISFNQVRKQLSDLAEVVMLRTLDLAVDSVQIPGYNGNDQISSPLAVMGLGKLGGCEVSYGSDLDLIFVLGKGRPGRSLEMVDAVRLSQRFISYLSIPLDAGPGYEIDSRLRPSGRQGPLVVTSASLANYHKTSQLWERQALLKMRRCLGPPGLGAKVKAIANQAIFERELPPDATASIHQLKLRMARERGRVKPETINLKFSQGGMVEAEFLTQYLQMIHGPDHKGPVRSPNTQEALTALAEKGLGPAALARIPEAYERLAKTASRLGLIYDRSGDRAAFKPEEIAAARLSGAGGDSLAELKDAMEKIETVYKEVFGI